jgi:uncharacterized circularly permuted ATP-grasp superfamily protein/uncharacterized alpha-E superfamily protein
MAVTDNEQALTRNWYQSDSGVFDEMCESGGNPRAHWDYFARAMQTLGPKELARRQQEALRLLRENGVTYNVYDDQNIYSRPWELDPIPFLVSSEEWTTIEAGLTQRAELFNLILADLYGPRELVKKGLLPLELIYSHYGFLRPCDNVTHAGQHQLVIHAVDLARGPGGGMWVVDDHTQAPSGAGYALENRMAMTRILPSLFRDCHVHRLALFFHALRSGLARISPNQDSDPNTVILTPGPRNETYFEHAYLASYLGYTLVQGDDLTVRDGKVWLKSLDGLQPVDIILRRVDGNFCDPLELREDSRLGVAGLLEAARRGNVSIANPLGSSILENPGLLAFLPKLCKQLLGQSLRLPSVATWWCGQQKERDYVLQNLHKLVIKPIFRHHATQPIFGAQLSKKELASLRIRILTNPHLYVGQEQVSTSTVPTLVKGQVEPRNAVLRTFMAAREDSYVVMPGGLTRVAAERGDIEVSNQAGGISKDTWVLASEPEKQVSLWLQPSADRITTASVGTVPSRIADNLFWVGRYTERAEATARMLRTILHKLNDVDEFSDQSDLVSLRTLLQTITMMTATYPGFVGEKHEDRLKKPLEEIRSITLDPKRLGSLASTLVYLVQSAYGVRDRWSTDMWRVIDDIDEQWSSQVKPLRGGTTQLRAMLDQLITSLLALSGLTMESMTRERGWRFLEIGRRMERSLMIISSTRSSLVPVQIPQVQNLLLEAMLVSHDSTITYRRRYRSYLQLATVLELLFFDDTNPRSLLYQLNHLQQYITELPRDHTGRRLSEEERFIIEASTQLRLSDSLSLSGDQEGGIYGDLDQLLGRLSHLLSECSNAITNGYFRQAQSPQQLAPTYSEPEP